MVNVNVPKQQETQKNVVVDGPFAVAQEDDAGNPPAFA